MWPKVHFRVMSSTSKITKRDKQMFLMWTVPITHLRHAFIQCCASFPLLRWEYLYAMAAAIKNMDSAVTWPRYQTKISEGSRVPDYNKSWIKSLSFRSLYHSTVTIPCNDLQIYCWIFACDQGELLWNWYTRNSRLNKKMLFREFNHYFNF